MNKISNILLKSLLETGIMLLIAVPSWLVVEKLMGYPEQVGVLVGVLLAISLGSLARGLKVTQFGGAEPVVVAILLLIVWNRQSELSTNSKVAWTVVLIAAPLATYAIGRVINKRSGMRQSVS